MTKSPLSVLLDKSVHYSELKNLVEDMLEAHAKLVHWAESKIDFKVPVLSDGPPAARPGGKKLHKHRVSPAKLVDKIKDGLERLRLP